MSGTQREGYFCQDIHTCVILQNKIVNCTVQIAFNADSIDTFAHLFPN